MTLTNEEKQKLRMLVRWKIKLGWTKKKAIEGICDWHDYKKATVAKYWKALGGDLKANNDSHP